MPSNELDACVLFRAELAEHIGVANAMADEVGPAFASLVDMALVTLIGAGKLILFGNGGSAADAQHWATELTVRFRTGRQAIAALALTTDSSALTAIGNDFGFEQVFARQIEALARPDDLAIGISTSGQSPNVIAGLATARAIGCRTAAFTGSGGGMLAALVDIVLMVPSRDTARIQEMHVVLGHALCGAIEAQLGATTACRSDA